jgi:hypothetical protein
MFEDETNPLDAFFHRSPDGQPNFENNDAPVLPMQFLRDSAIKLFDRYIAEQSGIEVDADKASFEKKCEFLSLQETETIVRDFSAADNGEMFAVGGESKKAAMEQLHKLMEALFTRIMSNVISAGVSRDLIDVAFDSDNDSFAFSVTDKGRQFVDDRRHLFEKDDEDVSNG